MISLATCAILVAGMVIGLVLGLTGGGGSILTVPLLVYVVGLETKTAIATSLLVVGVASLAALLPHSRAGNVYWRTGLVFGFAGMLGAYSGGWVARYLAGALLLLLFAGVMISSGVAMVRRRAPAPGAAHPVEHPNWPKIVCYGFGVGTVTGLVGAGGGFLVVPALALLAGMPMHAAVGTSLLVIAMNCFVGLAGYITHVPIDVESGVIVSALAITGTVAGSRLSRVFSAAQLRRGFGIFVLIIAAVLIVIEGSRLLADTYHVDRQTSEVVLASIEFVVAVGTLVFWKLSGASEAHPLH